MTEGGGLAGRILCLALLALCAAAGAAQASSVRSEGGVLVYVAGPGELNDVVVTYRPSPAGWEVRDRAPLVAGPGCGQTGPNTSSCDPAARLSFQLGDGDDRLQTSAPSSVPVFADAGPDSDHAFLAAGDSEVHGGEGDDLLQTNVASGGERPGLEPPANDVIDGGPGSDRAHPGTGNDRVQGGPGADYVAGGRGADEVDGGDDNDNVENEAGDDVLKGGPGRDRLTSFTVVGGGGNDVVDGGDGDDEISELPTEGNSVLRGGEGDDNIRLTPVTPGMPEQPPNSHYTMEGGPGQDQLLGGEKTDTIEGGAGNDALSGLAGDDTADGGEGSDVVDGDGRSVGQPGAMGNDTVRGGGDDDEVYGGGGADTVAGDGGDDTLAADDGDDVVEGGAGDDNATGGAGADAMDGGAGEDFVSGNQGPDTQAGGTGADVLHMRDSERNVAICGAGVDFVIGSRRTVAEGCDRVDRGGRTSRAVLGRSVVATPPRRAARIRLPEMRRFVPVADRVEVPVGTALDPSQGFVTVVSKRDARRDQSVEVSRGSFVVTQRRTTRPVTELAMSGGDFSVCPRDLRSRRARAAAGRVIRRLRGRGRGRFRMRGRGSSASVRGTDVIMEDRCDGTLTTVVSGTVLVRDFRAGKTVRLRRGQSYFARRGHR